MVHHVAGRPSVARRLVVPLIRRHGGDLALEGPGAPAVSIRDLTHYRILPFPPPSRKTESVGGGS
jgi:hypothetical protein